VTVVVVGVLRESAACVATAFWFPVMFPIEPIAVVVALFPVPPMFVE